MIEATCSACGTLNRIAEADVPVGAKFVACASCKSRVAVPGNATGSVPKLPPPVPPKGSPGIALDLADLPAPKRQSPLGGEAASRPAPKSALSSALDSELPAPKPRSAPASATLDLDDLITPVPAAEPAGISDLPAPRSAIRQPASRPAAPDPAAGISDLPAPRGRVATPSTAPKSVPASAAPIIDLPTPRPGGARALTDLPAPKAPKPAGITDLPMPKAPGSGIIDLPTPRSSGGGVIDLPAPRSSGGGVIDLPTPKPGSPTDLLTPKNAAPGGVDLPAPKGFFEDLPQPARGGKGGPGPVSNDVAPKGFFDDLPQPAKGTKGGPGPAANDVAPKGFFDDLPQKAQNRSGLPTPVGHEPPAPKGFFDDLPQPAKAREQNVMPKQGFGAGSIDLGDDPIEPLDLAADPIETMEPIEPLDLSEPSSARGTFDDLDLSAPSTPQTRVGAEEQEKAEAGIKFSPVKKTSGAATADKATLPSFSKGGAETAALELEVPREKGGYDPAKASQKLGPRSREAPVNEAALRQQKKRRKQVFAGFAVAFALLGAGGFYMYKRHAAQQERADAISEQLTIARKSIVADDANHWSRAAGAATKVIELDPSNAEAYGIAAESSIAGALADGKNGTARIGKGKKLISDALAAGVTGPALERAQALSTLTSVPDKAAIKLAALLAKSPKDPVLALYLGWAHTAAGNVPAAIAAYDQAAAGAPSVKLLATLGRARAKLVGADIEGARTDFTAVLEADKDNVPAQVGLAATLPVAQAQQQESDLLAILARKDIGTSDPRAVVQAWVLAGDLARKGGRLDAARERYRKALAIEAKDIAANTGLAEVELRDKKIAIATELITKVLTAAPNNANAQLVQCEISLFKNDIKDAEARIKVLAGREPPLAPIDLARLQMVKGKLHEIRKEDELAVEAYIAGAKLAGDRDLAPTFAAVAKLTAMAKEATAANDIDKAASYKGRAEELLLALAELAYKDPQLALTLGNAYLQSGDPAKAEPWFRRVIAERPMDPDALYQLGKVLRRLGKGDEAVEHLKKAREIAPTRAEIGMELARTYELLKRDDEAADLYSRLLGEPEPSLELRGHAGTFYVRTGKLDRAGEQGTKLLEVDRQSAVGHYLKAEGLLAAGHLEDARKEFTEAITQEREAIYLDGQGRATESLSFQRKDLALQDAALRSYKEALDLEPTIFSSLLGSGRLYVARREMEKAVRQLLAANKLKPNDAEVAFLLGAAYQELGTVAYKNNAIAWFKQSSSLKASAETAYRLGQLYQDGQINNDSGAIESYRTATKLAEAEIKRTGNTPAWYGEALYQLGDLSTTKGDEGTACRAFQQYLGTTPPPPPSPRVEGVKRALATGLKGSC